MICKVLTYSLTLLTIVAGLFVMSACQKEDVGKSEVMMTFNTRAIVSDKVSDADALERMKDLRVIMVRQDGTVVDNHLAEGINASSVKFTFSTPVKTGGEYFTFYAVANENALTPVPAEDNLLSWMKTCQRNVELTEQNITAIKIQEIGDGSAFTIPNGQAIPQTKIWTVYVPQQDKYAVPDPLQLEYVASKISVKFVNQTNGEQSLSNIRITGITPNGKGRLFSDYVKNGTHDSYSEVYVKSDVQLGNIIPFDGVTLAENAESAIQTYYTYPVDAANISNPMLYATWGGKEFHMPIGVTSIPRNKHIEIVVNILQGKLTVDYNVKDWKELELNIGGAPTAPDKNDGYYVEDWFADNNINIGGDTSLGDKWTLEDGTTIKGEQNWSYNQGSEFDINDFIFLNVPKDLLEAGNTILLYFTEYRYPNQNNEKIRIRFETGWGGDYDLKDDFVEFELGDDPTKEHVRHLTITEDMMMINGHGLKEMNLAIRVRDENDRPIHVQVTKLILITPTALNL